MTAGRINNKVDLFMLTSLNDSLSQCSETKPCDKSDPRGLIFARLSIQSDL